MFLLKIFIAVIGLVVIGLSILSFFTETTEAMGVVTGLVGAAIIFFVFKNNAVTEFLGVSRNLVDNIAFIVMVGGSVICAMDFEKLGAAMITAGWVAIGLILMQVVPIPFISNLIEVVSLPFTVACIPLLLVILLFM